jgi:ArsR family transcriptional regulator, arsenate/arsenite/antimonite-responsive transcriptional repressor
MVGRSAEATLRHDPEAVSARVELLKAIAEPTRLLVLELLITRGQRCHCELEEELDVPANRLSFHLKVLRDAGLVGTRRRGRRVSYHVHPSRLDAVRALLPRGPALSDEGPGCCATDFEDRG